MFKRKFLFIPLVLCTVICFAACLDDKGNSETYTSEIVVGYSSQMGGTTIRTQVGELAAPGLSLNSGDCFVGEFKIDYDNQPSSKYYTASDIVVKYTVSQDPAKKGKSENMSKEFNEPISNILGVVATPYYYGKNFIYLTQKASSEQRYKYDLFCNKDSLVGSMGERNVYSVYLRAKKDNESQETVVDRTFYHAFDMSSYFMDSDMAKDTTIESTGAKFRIIRIDLKYQTGEKDGKPVYKSYSNKPIMFSTFN